MIVHVYSGLASRCRTLSHAHKLAKKYNDKLVIMWPLEKACRISYKDVFAPDQFDDIETEIIEFEDGKLYRDLKGLILGFKFSELKKELAHRKKLSAILADTTYIDYNPTPDVGWSGEKYDSYLIDRWKQVEELCEAGKAACVYAHAFNGLEYPDAAYDAEDYSDIHFGDEYISEVKSLMGSKSCVGLHIRRTDHMAAIANSPIENFINAIRNELELNPELSFFLATDDKSQEELLISEFGDKIIVQKNKKWGRDDTSSMKSGIIDLLCLANCTKIYGSYTSAYSYFAAAYGKIKLL